MQGEPKDKYERKILAIFTSSASKCIGKSFGEYMRFIVESSSVPIYNCIASEFGNTIIHIGHHGKFPRLLLV